MKKRITIFLTIILLLNCTLSNATIVKAETVNNNVTPTIEEIKSFFYSLGTPSYIVDSYTDNVDGLYKLYDKFINNSNTNIKYMGSIAVLHNGQKISHNPLSSSIAPYNLITSDNVSISLATYAEYNNTTKKITQFDINVNYTSDAYSNSGNFTLYDFADANWDSSKFTYKANSFKTWLSCTTPKQGTSTTWESTSLSASTQGGIGWKTKRPMNNLLTQGHTLFYLLPESDNMYITSVSSSCIKRTTSINTEYAYNNIPTGLGFVISNGQIQIDSSIFSIKKAASSTLTYYTK